MERKRRASTEVQELMNAVKTDYEFFAKFDSPYQTSTRTKSHRTLSDNSKSPYLNQGLRFTEPTLTGGLNQLSKHSEEISVDQSLDVHQKLPELIYRASKANRRRQPCEQHAKARGRVLVPDKHKQSAEHFSYSHARNESQHEQMFQITTPDFWAIHDEEISRNHNPYSFTSKITRSISEPNSQHDPHEQITHPGGFICLSSESFTSRQRDPAAERKIPLKGVPQKTNYALTFAKALEKPPQLIRFETDTNIQFSAHETEVSENTSTAVRAFSVSEQLSPNTPTNIQELSEEEEKETEPRPINPDKIEKSLTKQHLSDSEDGELIIVESTPSSSDHEKSANQNAKNNQLTNENQEKHNEDLAIERKSQDRVSPENLSPSNRTWSEHVVTRVASLLWLGKDVVYPITLDEMRRRVQDPENFSFQMLIAYVRHSRAKGRQFLNYWKCQPSRKTSRPNVLSKLCEADAKELVKGIQKVNEEYFPQETLAKTLAANIVLKRSNSLTAHEEEGNNTQELAVQEKVKVIGKAR